MTFDVFLQKRLFDPLGMKHTTFYLDVGNRAELVTAYSKNKDTGLLEPVPPTLSLARTSGRPRATAGLLHRHDYAGSVKCYSTEGNWADTATSVRPRSSSSPHLKRVIYPLVSSRPMPSSARRQLWLGNRHLRVAHSP